MKTLKIIWNTVTWIIVILCVLLAVALVGVRAVKIEPYIVLSGSMEPEYKTGSVIYLKQVSASEIKVGDPITYTIEGIEDACTHRVIEVDTENQCFYTQGDANDTADGAPVPFDNLLGKPVFHIPYLGYVADFINQPVGRMVIISAVCLLILMLIIPAFFTVDDKSKESEKMNGEEVKAVSQETARLEEELAELKAKVAQQQADEPDSSEEEQ